jgi:hypothetical protein
MSNISQWSTSAASNNSAPPDGSPEGQAPSTVNDCMREIMAASARQYQDSDGSLATGGTSNAYTLTTNNSHAALADIGLIVFRADRNNTGAATLAVDGLAAKAIELQSAALASGDLVQDAMYAVVYNSASDTFDLVNAVDRTAGLDPNTIVDHSGVSVIAANGGLAASNNDLTSNIGLSIDVSTLTEFTATAGVDLTTDQVILDDGGTEKRADVACLIRPIIATEVSGTTDSLLETHFGTIRRYSNTGTVTITLPNSLSDGFWCVLQKTGATGTTTISAATTLNTPNSATNILTQYNAITVLHLGSNVWTAWGGFG